MCHIFVRFSSKKLTQQQQLLLLFYSIHQLQYIANPLRLQAAAAAACPGTGQPFTLAFTLTQY